MPDYTPYTGDLPTAPAPVEYAPVREEDVPFLTIDGKLKDLEAKLPASRADIQRHIAEKEALKKSYDALQINKVLGQFAGGGTYDPDRTFDANSVSAFFKAADMKGRSDLWSEQYRKFKEAYPQGSIAAIDTKYGGTTLVGRESKDQPYRRIGSWQANVVGAVGTLANAGAVAGSIAASATGVGTLPAMAIAGGAAALGSIGDYYVEKARGYQDSPLSTMVKDAAFEGLVNTVFEGGGRLLFGVKGGYAAQEAERKAKFARLMKETGVPIFRGETAGALWRAVYDVTRPLSNRAQRNEANRVFQVREQLIARRAGESTNTTPGVLSDEQLRKAALDQRFEVMQLQGLTPLGMTKQEIGVALREANEKLDGYVTEASDRLYGYANRAADDEISQFSLQSTHDSIADMEKGHFLYSKPKEEIIDGVPVTTQELQQTNKPFADPRLRELVDELKTLDPTVVANPKNNAFIALLDLRKRAGNIMVEAKDGQTKAEATAVWNKLSEALKAPTGGSPDYLARWTVANDTYHDMMKWRRTNETQQALAEGVDAETVAAQYLAPNQFDTLTHLKKQLDRMVSDSVTPAGDKQTAQNAWETLRKGFFSALTSSNDNLLNAPRTMATMGPEQLDLMVDKPIQKAIITASDNLRQLQSGPIQKLLEKNRTEAEKFAMLAGDRSITQSDLESFVNTLGGKDSPAAAGIRAALFDKMLAASEAGVKSEAGQKGANPAKLRTEIKEMFASGRMDALFGPEEKKAFEKFEEVMSVVQKFNSLGATQASSQTAVDFTPRHMMQGSHAGLFAKAFGILGNDWLGGFLSRPINVEKLLAAADNNNYKHGLKVGVLLQGNILTDLQQQNWTAQGTMNESPPYDMTPAEIDAMRKTMENNPSPTMGSWMMDMLGGAANTAREYLPYGGSSAPAAPSPAAPGPQGSLQAPVRGANMPSTNMAQTMPPRPDAGQKYAALFPHDSLGAMAASGGIASLRG